MTLLGSGLLLWSAGLCWLLQRRGGRELIQLGEALLEDLAVLKSRACTVCLPLPQILARELSGSMAAQRLWQPFCGMLREGNGAHIQDCWDRAVALLPRPLDRLMGPLGTMLSRGGEPLARVIDETREELTGFLRAERQRRATADRLAAALYLSGACMVILVLI